MKRMIIALGATFLALPALAQTGAAPAGSSTIAPSNSATQGSPATANSGPGATGIVQTERTPAGAASNNSAGAGNAEQPSKAAPTTGKGGGG